MTQNDRVRLVLVDADAHERSGLRQAVERHERIELVGVGQSGRDAVQLTSRLKPDVLVMDAALPGIDGLEVAGRIAETDPSIAIIVMSSDDSVEAVRHAMRCGVRTLLAKPVWTADLVAAVLEAIERRERSTARGVGSIWAVGGAKGAAGSTTLAVNSAVALAARGLRVLLLDLDLSDGDCSFYLDMPPRVYDETVFELLCGTDGLSAASVRSRVRSYDLPMPGRRTLYVVDAAGQPVLAHQILEERLTALLEMLGVMYDIVIVDLPAGRLLEYPAAAVIDCAERLMLASNTDIRSLKALAKLTRALREACVPLEKMDILLNGLIPQPGFHAHRWLGERRAELASIIDVPLDLDACARAVLRGIPVVLDAPDSRIARFVRDFAAVRSGCTDTGRALVSYGPWSLAHAWRRLNFLLGRAS